MKLNNAAQTDRKHSIATDMFAPDIVQVFARKTGKYLGYIKQGEENTLQDPEEEKQEEIKETINPNQLNLF